MGVWKTVYCIFSALANFVLALKLRHERSMCIFRLCVKATASSAVETNPSRETEPGMERNFKVLLIYSFFI